mmetsp:Transcript_21693/g.29083  ORF Transcript_21693/g.29083 Transcript_21693/m.29083 type:complete len:110 (+) Transcript_21693:1090-1419(+)
MYRSGHFNLEDISSLTSIIAKIDQDSGGNLWIKDGLLFANLQSDYNEGVNPLTLHWKDSVCSLFPIQKSQKGCNTVSLQLTEGHGFTTVEETLVPMTAQCEFLLDQACS